jgi:4-coumarate--CoA ligase
VCEPKVPNYQRQSLQYLGLTYHLHQSVYVGIEVVVMAKFELEKYCAAVQTHKITLGFVVPPILLQLSNEAVVKNYDLRSLRVFTCAAAPLRRELIYSVYQRLGVPIRQSYGMTEMTGSTHLQVRNQPIIKGYKSCR